MFLPGHLMTVVWLTSTYLCVCQGSPTDALKQPRYNEDGEKVSYSAGDRRHGTTHSQAHIYPHTLHHRPHAHKSHGQRNSTHSHPFKSYSVKRHDLEKTAADDHTVRLAAKKIYKQADEERTNDPNKEKRNEGRRRRKKDGKRGRRINYENLTWDNDVDDVLAALVGYSRDPSLWRFVHSVVAELDYSKQASNSSPPSATRRHHAANHFTSWSPKGKEPSDKNAKNVKQGQVRNQSTKIVGGDVSVDYSGGGIDSDSGNTESDDTLTPDIDDNNTSHQTTFSKENLTPTPSRFPAPNSPEQFHAPLAGFETSHVSPTVPSNAKMGIRSTHPPHFIFHKVYIDTNYDPHTRLPYHRPVLAVKVVNGEKTKTIPASTKENENGFPDAMDGIAYQLPADSTQELPDKLEELLIQQSQRSSEEEEEEGKEEEEEDEEEEGQRSREAGIDPMYGREDEAAEFLQRQLQRDWAGNDDRALEDSHDGQGWQEVIDRRHHGRHFLHRLRQVHSFESQMKFLRRWQERLLRKRSQWSSYYQTSMT